MKLKTKVFKFITVTLGISLIIWKAGFITLLGIFLLMWANNADYAKKY
jgi:hypothetical protein